ncbi:hypothetical protein [Paenibacillus sp. J2TS4]|uniref:hypothetical protein n=1 Tax=Paenibacillus sp. J2TS4 TaxID=2807194 RepID=UPI001B24DF46|nr:hypothetical protein [Paenibacillus sp. J2TS4]GIP32805.1 hypothetical protein J2TS4_20150 [Paenibacillus sp. J2TS4]
MRKLVVVFTVIAILLVGCSSRPPMPVLKAGKIEIPAVLGTYSWKTFNKQVIADAPGPDYLVKDLTPIAVKPKEEVLVKFSSKPSKMILSRWVGQETVEQVELDSNQFTLPQEKGEHIFSIRAEWGEHKSGLYAFIVKVE